MSRGGNRLVDDSDGRESECGVGCQEYQFCSSPKGFGDVEAAGKESRWMGMQNYCICIRLIQQGKA